MMKDRRNVRVSQRFLVGSFGASVLALAAGGYWLYHHETQAVRSQKQSELKAIAQLKANQIAAWRMERMGDARVHGRRAFLRSAVGRWLSAAGDASLGIEVRENLESIREAYGYENLIVAGRDGRILFSLDPRSTVLDASAKQLVAKAIVSRDAVFGDFIRCPTDNQVHVDVAVAILDPENRPVAALILRSDPEQYLYPLIQSWPTPSRTAETLLIRRDGDDVLFLNKLRHRPDPALTLRVPLSRSETPCVQAALGHTGGVEGRDNRGVEVLAEILPVAGSPWFMVAKVDADEILAEARYRGRFILLFTALSMFMAGAMAAFVFSFRQKLLYQNLYRAERQRRQAEEEIRATFYSIGDGVISTDATGRVTRMNPVAEQLTGWSEAEALGKPVEQVFHIVNEETRAEVENPIQRVLHEGTVVNLANHTLLLARDGTERPIADSGAPIYNDQGQVAGAVLVFRDQTEQRRTEESLRESQEKFAGIVSAAQDAILMIDPCGCISLWNQSAERIFGYSAAEAMGQNLHTLLAPTRLHEAQEKGSAEFFRSGRGAALGEVLELPALRKDGKEIPIELSLAPLQLCGQWHAVGIVRDISERKRAEQMLRDSAMRHRTLFESSADAVMTLAPPSWNFTSCNPATVKMFAVKDEAEFTSLGPWQLSPEMQPDGRPSAEKAKEMIETAMRGGSHFFEWTHKRHGGEDFPATVLLTRMELAGQVVLQATVRDVTVQKRAEERAKLDEARATTLLELSQTTDNSAAEIANQALESAIRLTGSTIGYIAFANEDETVLTMHYWSKTAMTECATIDKPIVYPVKDTGLWGEAIRQRRPVVVNDYAAPNPLKKGTPPGHVPLTRHMNIPVFDGGRIVAVAGIGNKAEDYQDDDVRQLTLFMDGMWRILCRKRVEEALKEFNRQLESAAAQVKTLMSNVIEKSVFTERFENPSLVPCWEEKQCDNTACPSYQNPGNLRCWEAAGTLCGGTPPESSVEKHADCSLCEVYRRARANPVMDLGETFNTMIAILSDRQEQLRDSNQKLEAAIEHANRMTEQAQCANRAKSAFLANMSHEIRTPMTSMLGYTELLMDDALSAADRKAHLTTVRRNAEYLLQLINDILDLSKIESGKMVMDLGPCRLASTIADVASMMRPRAEQRKNKIEVRYTGQFPETIRSDSNRIRQVIVNLVGNAVKFTEGGSIRINMSFLPQWRGDQSAVRVEVTDTGIGIRQEALARLFTPFTQAETSTTRKYGGTGLGLAISRQIVAALGGELTVKSALGEGSTFTVMIPTGDLSGVPLLQSPGEVICEDDAGTRWTPAAGALRGVRILLAEDSPDNQELLSTVLGNVGAELAVVENGRLAVEHAKAGAFDVVLMDMNMPEMDGYEATRTLRDRGYRRPILALTANAMSGDCEQCLAAGCDAHLAKPIDRKQLIETVARYAGVKGGRSEPPALPSRAEIPAPIDGLVSRFADDPQLANILPRFVERLPEQLQALCKALEEDRLDDAQRLAHRLKGAGGSYGYPTLSEAAKSLEFAAKAHDADRAAAALAEVKAVGAAIQIGFSNRPNAVGQPITESTDCPQEDWQL